MTNLSFYPGDDDQDLKKNPADEPAGDGGDEASDDEGRKDEDGDAIEDDGIDLDDPDNLE